MWDLIVSIPDICLLPSLLTRVPTHKKYCIPCYPLRTNSGWLPNRCAYFILMILWYFLVILSNRVARTLKKLHTSKGDYWMKQRLSSIASLFKCEFLIWTNIVAPHAWYQAPRSLDFWFWRRFLKGFYRIWAWRPSWSCDQDLLNKLLFTRLHIKFKFNWPSGFRGEDV